MADYSDPFGSIQEYWGEELSPELAERIINAPMSHLNHFHSFLIDRTFELEHSLPALSPGELRPIISAGAVDITSHFDFTAVRFAAPLLLYAHEVVLNDVSYKLCSDNPEIRRLIADWLIAIRPLFDERAVHFRIIESRKRHPSWGPDRAPFTEAINELNDPDIERFVDRCVTKIPAYAELSGTEQARFRGEVLYQLGVDVSSYYGYERIWPRKVHRLLRSRAEYVVMRTLFEHVAAVDGDAEVLRLLRLSQLAMPGLVPDTKSLVVVRRAGDEFAAFRHHLALALSQLDLRDGADPKELDRARELIAAECEPIRARLNMAVEKSPALEALKTGTVGFGVSALAAVGGFAAGGSLTSAVASAAVAKATDASLAYIRAYKKRREAERIADLVATFYSFD